jgi:hypothetical protein
MKQTKRILDSGMRKQIKLRKRCQTLRDKKLLSLSRLPVAFK